LVLLWSWFGLGFKSKQKERNIHIKFAKSSIKLIAYAATMDKVSLQKNKDFRNSQFFSTFVAVHLKNL
jgi:hypothetical protein